jgi:hypothetical protein
MRQLSIILLGLISALAGNIYAQNGIGNNSVIVSTTTEGNVAWSANIDGNNRKGYIDNASLEVCNHKEVDENVIIPTTTYLYPNQLTDVLFFSGNGTDTYSVTILDPSGNIIARKESKEDESMDISAFEDGTYTLEITRGKNGKTYTQKIIKE